MAEPVSKENALVRRAETLPLALPQLSANARLAPTRTVPLDEREPWTVLSSKPRKRKLGIEAVLMALVAANVALYTVTVVQEAGLTRLQSEIRDRRQELVRLRTELARVQSLDQIEQSAKTLGMVRPKSALYVAPPAPLPLKTRVARAPFGAPEGY
jgi:hypothetical protein